MMRGLFYSLARYSVLGTRCSVLGVRCSMFEVRCSIIDFRSSTPDSRFPIPDPRLPTPDSRLPIPDSRTSNPEPEYILYVIFESYEKQEALFIPNPSSYRFSSNGSTIRFDHFEEDRRNRKTIDGRRLCQSQDVARLHYSW